jgi:lipoprotein-anchoring transpeptidase ErfK/SrfK
MKRAVFLIFATLLLPATAAAQDPQPTPTPTPTATPQPEERIRPGVFAAGVDVGNLTIGEATVKLQQSLAPVMGQDVVIEVAGRRFHLTPKQVRFAFDAERTAKRALYAGQNASPPPADGGGTAPDVNVLPAVDFRRLAIKRFANKIAKDVYVAPRDANVRITLRRIFKKKSRAGRTFDVANARKLVEAAFTDPLVPRLIAPRRTKVPAKVKTKDLRRTYGTIVTIDRNSFRLRLFKGLKLSKSYGVAVGAVGYPTPTGRFSITNKAVNPVWTAPNSPWAAEFAGQSVPGGSAANPLKARWMGIVNGVGIHGTGAEYSIGSRASHGCIRMRVADVIDLYPRVPVGTPVLIK